MQKTVETARQQQIKDLQDPTDAQDAVTKAYVDTENTAQTINVILSNGNDANNQQIKGLADPTDNQDAVTEIYTRVLVEQEIKKTRKKINTLLYISNGF